jgi:uncharacterized protein
MNVVIDVNVWISGLLWGGIPAQVLQLAQQRTIASYISLELLLELETSLRRPKFQTQLQKRDQTVESLSSIARSISTLVVISSIEIPELRDQTDVKILATAIAAQAQILITGDLDLLILHPFRAIQILTPSDFQQIVR